MSTILRLSVLLVTTAWALFAAAPLAAQSSLERLETELRSRGTVPSGTVPPGSVPPSNAVPQPGSAQSPGAAQPSTAPGYLGLVADDRLEQGRGIRIIEVVADGPAARGGLQTGDLITRVGDQPVAMMSSFAQLIETTAPGMALDFEVIREGQRMRMQVVLGKRPQEAERRFPEFGPIPGPSGSLPEGSTPAGPGAARPMPVLGVQLAAVSPEVQQALALPSTRGALVVSVSDGSPAALIGLTSGVVIVAFDGQRVDTPADLSRYVAESAAGRTVRITYFLRGALEERSLTLAARPADAEQLPPLVPQPPMSWQPPGAQQPPGLERPLDWPERVELLESRIRSLEAEVARLRAMLGETTGSSGAAGPVGTNRPATQHTLPARPAEPSQPLESDPSLIDRFLP